MIKLLAIKKDTPLEIRGKFSFSNKKLVLAYESLKEIFEEVIIVNTCNRTEIYFTNSLEEESGYLLNKLIEKLDWDFNLKNNLIMIDEDKAIKHLFEVTCGFHSKILGEDQILGQIKNSYKLAMDLKTSNNILKKLFEIAIHCGKKFKTENNLFNIPVSSSSIAVNKALKNNVKNFMVIGYGEVGQLVTKYILSNKSEKLIIAVRDKSKVLNLKDDRVQVMNYNEAKLNINNVDCVISCTSAPHYMIEYKDVINLKKNLIIFDLAVPRDIDIKIKNLKNIKLYDIDDISKIDDINKELRKEKMIENKYIIGEHISEFNEWYKLRKISNIIKEIKKSEMKNIEDRVKTFKIKNKNNDIELAEKLIKSMANHYVNKCIQVIKEETLKGSEEECLKSLKKIFL